MNHAEKQLMIESDGRKAWVEHWKRIGPVLERVRHDELRAMSEEASARAFVSLSEFALDAPHPTPRLTSGFVEQQRLFLKLRRHAPSR
jgi:hypothetical protein